MLLKDCAKFVVGLVLCVAARLALMPLPNVEPIMAAMLPYAKKYGKIAGALFALLAFFSIDFITGKLGLWTLYCALAYAGVGFAAGSYLPKHALSRWRFAGFAFVGVIFYDAVTAAAFGLQFGQPLWATALAQIPFTALHLLGGVGFAFVASPLLSKYFVESDAPFAALFAEKKAVEAAVTRSSARRRVR